jgi:hypothetical protein
VSAETSNSDRLVLIDDALERPLSEQQRRKALEWYERASPTMRAAADGMVNDVLHGTGTGEPVGMFFIEGRPTPADDLAAFLEDHRRKIAEAFSVSESNQREHD